jgi:VanZ family protein
MSTAATAVRRLVGPVLAVYWLAMFLGTHWPRFHLENFPSNTDKFLHFSAYAGLGFLLAAYRSQKRLLGLRQFAEIFALTIVYAVADELLQIPVGRDCEFLDGVADAAGSLTGLAAFLFLRSAWKYPPVNPAS